MRVLDELAAAFHALGGKWGQRHVQSSLDLSAQFSLSPDAWRRLGKAVGCVLPPLVRHDEQWVFPDGWSSVHQLALYVAQRRDWLPPADYSVAEWREAQVFAGVRDVLMEALNVDREQVVRKARLMADLGAA